MPRPRRETVSSTKKGVYHIRCEFTQGHHFLGPDPWSNYFILRRDEADKRRELTEEDFEEILDDHDRVAAWRERLCYLGGFMQELNGRIASRIKHQGGQPAPASTNPARDPPPPG